MDDTKFVFTTLGKTPFLDVVSLMESTPGNTPLPQTMSTQTMHWMRLLPKTPLMQKPLAMHWMQSSDQTAQEVTREDLSLPSDGASVGPITTLLNHCVCFVGDWLFDVNQDVAHKICLALAFLPCIVSNSMLFKMI